MTLDELNSLPPQRAADVFTACCGAHRWVSAMVERRPYSSIDDVIQAGNEIWRSTSERDWREAFAHHPRIGESRSAVTQDARASMWSSGEQSHAATADADIQRQLAGVNAEYEDRFGYIYIVCAAGRTARDLLDIARARVGNDPRDEIRIAADEQRKITELRLHKLLVEAS